MAMGALILLLGLLIGFVVGMTFAAFLVFWICYEYARSYGFDEGFRTFINKALRY